MSLQEQISSLRIAKRIIDRSAETSARIDRMYFVSAPKRHRKAVDIIATSFLDLEKELHALIDPNDEDVQRITWQFARRMNLRYGAHRKGTKFKKLVSRETVERILQSYEGSLQDACIVPNVKYNPDVLPTASQLIVMKKSEVTGIKASFLYSGHSSRRRH